MSRLRPLFSYANVVSTLALFIVLGGGAYAATKITGRQVKDGSLTGKDIKNRSLTGKDIRNRSLSARNFRKGQLPQGPKGDPGSAGAKGAAGAPGPAAKRFDFTRTNTAPVTTIYNSGGVALIASCLRGGNFQSLALSIRSAAGADVNYGGVVHQSGTEDAATEPFQNGFRLSPNTTTGLSGEFQVLAGTTDPGPFARAEGQLIWSGATQTVTFNLHTYASHNQNVCQVQGTAVTAR